MTKIMDTIWRKNNIKKIKAQQFASLFPPSLLTPLTIMGLIFSWSKSAQFLKTIKNSNVRWQNSSLTKTGNSNLTIFTLNRDLGTWTGMFCMLKHCCCKPSPVRRAHETELPKPRWQKTVLQEQPCLEIQELFFLASSKASTFGYWS